MKIELFVTSQVMGANVTESDVRKWANYIEARLQEAFPDAKVDVYCDSLLSSTRLDVIDGDHAEVNDFIQQVWNREDWHA